MMSLKKNENLKMIKMEKVKFFIIFEIIDVLPFK